MSQHPLVSIIIPCYNKASFLKETIMSVKQQHYDSWECILVDDGSTDATEQVIREVCGADVRFTYVHQENAGVSAARNKGINIASGTHILPLDADDKILPTYIEKAIQAFMSDPSLTVVYCKAKRFGAKEGLWELPPFSLESLAISNVIFNAAMYRKSDSESIGGYDESMRSGLEDWEFWIHLLKNGGNVLCLPEVGFLYRIDDNSRNHTIDASRYEAIYTYLNTKHLDFFNTYLGSHTSLIKRIHRLEKDYAELQLSKKNAVRVLFNALSLFSKRKK